MSCLSYDEFTRSLPHIEAPGREDESSAHLACRLYAAFFTLPCGSMTNFFGDPSLKVL
jgi:hypothetical protein